MAIALRSRAVPAHSLREKCFSGAHVPGKTDESLFCLTAELCEALGMGWRLGRFPFGAFFVEGDVYKVRSKHEQFC